MVDIYSALPMVFPQLNTMATNYFTMKFILWLLIEGTQGY